ncbi:hypothetical protein [Fusicatenibacter saccharivorans]|uniref:hypothetical protein n=1 Tax=Fusicatenibacter saccharivorans TaxID=1150298 RepID=UPI003219836E
MNANIIYTIFFFILPIRKSALLPLKIKMKESTVSPTVLFFMPFSHFLPSSSQQSHADPPIRADPDLPSRPHYQPRRRPSLRDAAWQRWKSGQEKPEKMEAFRETEIWCSTPDFKAF